jgi:hypothetical protein
MLVSKKATLNLGRFEGTRGITENLMRVQPFFFFGEEGVDEITLSFGFASPHQFAQAGFRNASRERLTAYHRIPHV